MQTLLTAPRHRRTWRLTAVSAVVGLMAAAGTVALAGPWDAGQRTAERVTAAEGPARPDGPPADRAGPDAKGPSGDAASGGDLFPAPTAGLVLSPLIVGGEEAAGGLADAVSLTTRLEGLLDNAALGDRLGASVVDPATGEQLLGQDADRALPPASTVKLVTALAALDALGADHRLATRVVLDDENSRVVLVGGGDTTLTTDGLAALAEDTAEALASRGVEEVGVGYDADQFSGKESQHPLGVNDNIAPLTSLMVNAGRLDDSTRGPAPRSPDPAADAAAEFVERLADAGVTVTGSSAAPRSAPAGAERLAVHESAPVSDLVERALTDSDNDLSESLGRQVALADGETADLSGVSRALTQRLEAAGVPTDGVRLADASGLDRDGRLTAGALTALLTAAADPDRPEYRPVLTGLPVAGFTGTLSSRYPDGGAGLVRAKTGTLTGVNALAGTAVHPDGRVLVFAFLALGTTAPAEAESALDLAAAALTGS